MDMILRVRVQPRAKNNALAGQIEQEWKLLLTAPPLEGRANQACIEFLPVGCEFRNRGFGWCRVRNRATKCSNSTG